MRWLIIIMSLFLVGCKFSVSTNLGDLKPLPKNAKPLAEKIIDDYYAQDFEAMRRETPAEYREQFSDEFIQQINRFKSDSSQPENKKYIDHQYGKYEGVKTVSLLYHIPMKAGREDLTVTFLDDPENCCQLIGFHFNAKIGSANLMDEYVEKDFPVEIEN